MAQSGAIESVRNWYEAYSKLDSTGLFEFWALDHKDFIYAHDGEVLKREQFIDFLNNVIKNTEQIIKTDILEGHLHEISNDAACYTTKAVVKGIASGNTISFVVTATFVLKKIDTKWKCVHCSASHVFD
jgi:ketosteroid isomerase-like protein